MARVSETEIERIKAEISVERLAESAGVELKRHGKDLLGRCPFHDDRTPSLVITPAKNLWHCLGACQTGGSSIDWVMKREGVSFRHAVELLRAEHPSLVAELSHLAAEAAGAARKPPKQATTRKLAGELETGQSDTEVLKRVVSFYERTLSESPEALAYLEKRGLNHPDLLSTFRLGYANRTLSYRLPAKNRKEGAALREQLQSVGILRKSGHEHFNGSLVIPVFNAEGHVVEMYGRKVGERLRAGTPEHLYLPGPHVGVFNEAGLKDTTEVILCESLIDALTFWCAGFRNVTASYGVEGFTEAHLSAFKAHGIKKVLIAYDRDEAGDRAAQKLAEQLCAEGFEAWRVQFPHGMDANEYAQKVKPAKQALETAVRSASWLGKGKAPKREAPEGRDKAQPNAAPPVSPPVAEEPAIENTEERCPSAAEEGAKSVKQGDISSLVAPTGREPEEPRRPAPQSVVAERAVVNQEPPSLETSNDGDQVELRFGDRMWRIRGLSKNKTPGILKVNILLRRERFGFHVDTLELYSARHRAAFVAQAAQETSSEERVIKRDLGQVLLQLEQLQERQISGQEESKERQRELSEQETQEALALLKSPDLSARILEDFKRLGVVGERKNILTSYLAATSRKLDRPLAIVVQSSSAAGKSSLMEAVLRLMPPEERVSYSAMTGQSLFYMGEMELSHKILSVAEEEGAERAAYALKLLQSEGELTIASTGKDPVTGRLITQEYRVEGPVMIFLTTTALSVDEELLNRCIVLSVDETPEQTRAIHEEQRFSRTLKGQLKSAERGQLMELHQNAQRLLRPLLVANPFAGELSFSSHQTRSRRDHMKYLTLIEAVALLHQYQRPVREVEHQGARVRYIEVTRGDIELADELAADLLSRNLDELPAQTRRLLGLLSQYVSSEAQRLGLAQEDYHFTRREVREALGLGDTQLKVHLSRLVELEYLAVHRSRQAQSYAYELLYFADVDGCADDGVDERATSGGRGKRTERSGGGRPLVGEQSGGGRHGDTKLSMQKTSGAEVVVGERTDKARLGKRNGIVVHRSGAESSTSALPLAATIQAAVGGE